MKTEQGKCYRSETGVKVGPMYVNYDFCWPEADGDGPGPIWLVNGTPFNSKAREIGALVAEWEDAPQDDEWSEWERVTILEEHPAFYTGCVYQREKIHGASASKVRIKLRPEDKTFFGLSKTRFTDDEINRIAKAVADAVAGALRDS